ncbi:hypothetical protein T4B_2393 [Trichinella pseudospiralis]|uniref:Uncharacterized protein n=1 Tax=Trichinella pseudospiralis TaxID=6337 RepID=A0A0V1IHH2_TRIPS|nr:hypothetical protein T4B_2393 [Trichinella pseudospiralis]
MPTNSKHISWINLRYALHKKKKIENKSPTRQNFHHVMRSIVQFYTTRLDFVLHAIRPTAMLIDNRFLSFNK